MQKGLLPIDKAGFGRYVSAGEGPATASPFIDCNPVRMTDLGPMPSNKPEVCAEGRKASAGRATLAIIPRYERMSRPPIRLEAPRRSSVKAWLAVCVCVLALYVPGINAQDNPLDKVHVPPPATTTPDAGAPAGVDAPAATGAGKAKPGSLIRMNGDMVLVPITGTQHMNRPGH